MQPGDKEGIMVANHLTGVPVTPSMSPGLQLATISAASHVVFTGISKMKVWSTLTQEEKLHLGHATTGVSAMNNVSIGKQHSVVSNMWVLATSLLFVLNVHEPNYVMRFRDSILRMNIDDQA
ncbi:hypothetical protein M422DRAFT_260247 [Sphaerobolus stellatus SS14]|uniref:Uncharacterized protein n=1 Tax=Sphaerobolus stellatus (strain SS14) TaxID=990650 RepID=A0A0C9VIE8_SPHS4|nr:hypothetical protein M422DRAFT_260247 [Sphaerobolus stellatus SS14]